MASKNSFLELDVDKRLFHEVVHGCPERCEEQLNALEDVDVKDSNQRTLLHVAVRVGGLKWVERLLELGADPNIRNKNNATALEVAVEMKRKHPGEEDRRNILKLLQLVLKRDDIKQKSSTRSESVPFANDCIDLKPSDNQVVQKLVKNVFKLSREVKGSREDIRGMMAFLIDALSENIPSSSRKTSSGKENVKSFKSKDMPLLKKVMSVIKLEVKSLSRGIVSILTVSNQIMKELEESRDAALKNKTSDYSTVSKQVLSVRKAIKDFNKELAGRDTVLEKLENSVTLLAQEYCPLECQSAASGGVQKVAVEVGKLRRPNAGVPQSVDMNAEERLGVRCVDEMMRKTIIFNEDIENVSKVRRFYRKLYDLSDITSSMLMFLQFQEEVQIWIDCGSYEIRRMKSRVRDFDGVEHKNSKTFVDLEELKVYLGGKVDRDNKEEYVIGQLSRSLARMSVYLAFKNGGKPYSKEDSESGWHYRRIVEDAEWKCRWGRVNYDWYIHWALQWRTQLGMEIDVIAAVPGMIAHYGPMEGMSRLRRQLPSLVNFYQDHVVPTLSRRSKRVTIGDTVQPL